MGTKNLKDVNNLKELEHYLISKGTNHNNYRHYTNKMSLFRILGSKSLQLSILSSHKTNDFLETTKNSYEERNRLYAISFAYGESENMAMWGLYSLPYDESLCISFPIKTIKELIQTNKNDVIFIREDTRPVIKTGISRIFITDIAYVSGKRKETNSTIKRYNEILYTGEKPQFINISEVKYLTGFIKNMAWSYENEVRMMIRLDDIIMNEKVAVPLTDDMIKNMTITLAPWSKESLKNEIKQEVKRLGYDSIKVNDSEFEGLINYRKLCDFCKHERFLNRNEVLFEMDN